MDYTASTFESSWANLLEVLSNLGGSAVHLMSVVNAFAYVAGIFFVGFSFVMMTKSANPQARAAYSNSGWFWSFFIGVLMFALPETMTVIASVFMDTSMADISPLAYAGYLRGENLAVGNCRLGGLRPLFVVFGYIAVVRGLMVARTVGMYGNYSRGNATVGRATVLCFSGIGLVHMQQMISGINSITGLRLGAGLC